MLTFSHIGGPSLEQTGVPVFEFLALHQFVNLALGVAHRLNLILVNGLLVNAFSMRFFGLAGSC